MVPGNRAAGGRDTVARQVSRDLAGRSTGGIFGENAHDHLGLFRIDLALARLAGNGAIAIGDGTGKLALAHAAGMAAPDLGAEIGQEQRAYQSAHADVQLGRLAFIAGTDLDAGKLKPLVDRLAGLPDRATDGRGFRPRRH